MDKIKTSEEPDFLSMPSENKISFGSKVADFIQTLVVFAAILSAVYLFVAQPHKVSGSSMVPNFHNGDYIITDKVSYHFSAPKRGDIIVLKNPRDTAIDFIKRIIGIPGEKIMISGGKVYVNGKILNENYLDARLFTPSGAFLQEGQEITIAQDQYIAIGDNRTASSDSREWGFVSKDKIIGKVFLRYLPVNAFRINPAAAKY